MARCERIQQKIQAGRVHLFICLIIPRLFFVNNCISFPLLIVSCRYAEHSYTYRLVVARN